MLWEPKQSFDSLAGIFALWWWSGTETTNTSEGCL